MKRHVTGWAIAALLGCGGCAPPEGVEPRPAAADTRPQQGGTLFRRLDVEITSLNPVLAATRYDRLVSQYLFTPVIHLDADLRPVAALAESWQVSPDGRLYTFKLNPRATFGDGRPVRAADVVFTLRKIVDPEVEAQMVASGFELLDLARTRAVNDHTVEVGFREGLASQLVQFHNVLVLPEHVYGEGSFRDDFNESAVGSGPYRLIRWSPGKEVVVQRRTDYWEKPPWIESVVFKIITNGATAWNAALRGEIDETILPTDVWLREQKNPSVTRTLRFLRFYGLAYNYIAWNGRNPLFADKRIRRALSMSLDTAAIISGLYGGTARAMNGHFVPEQWAYNPQVPMIAYDPAGAKQIFTSVGWMDTDGDGVIDRGGSPFRFSLTVMSGNSQALAIAQSFQATLKEVGVRADIAVLDGAVAIQRILAGNYEAAYLSWDLDPDPDPFALFHSSQIPPRGQNFVYYSSPEANQLIQQGRRELKLSSRADIYRKLHAVLAEDQPYTWVTQPSMKWVVNRRVNGVRESKAWGLFLWYPGEFDWWLSGGGSAGSAAER